MRKPLVAALALTATATSLALTTSTPTASAATGTGALQAVGLQAGGRTLVRFATDAPARTTVVGAVSGLQTDTRLVGLDRRVADGRLYGLGNAGGIYALSGSAATLFGRLTVPLEGTLFGVDVNPAADALRIVSNTGQNLRQGFLTPNGPTAVDTRLSTPPTVGDTTGVAGAAYTNNDTSAQTATTLYTLSPMSDLVAVQAPANSGTLSPTGSLTVNAEGNVGFDVFSTLRGDKAVSQTAYASLREGSVTSLFRIDLFTGEATRVGALGHAVIDIALPLAQG